MRTPCCFGLACGVLVAALAVGNPFLSHRRAGTSPAPLAASRTLAPRATSQPADRPAREPMPAAVAEFVRRTLFAAPSSPRDLVRPAALPLATPASFAGGEAQPASGVVPAFATSVELRQPGPQR